MDRINPSAHATQTSQPETAGTGSSPRLPNSVTTHTESASTSAEQTQLPNTDSATPQKTTTLDQYSIVSGASALPYLTGLLLRAGATATSDHVDPATLGRARLKIQRWVR